MVEIGRMNELEVVKEVDFGVYLDGGRYGEILVPKRYVPDGCLPGDFLSVFVYCDSEDRLIATTETPKGQVGDFVCLPVVAVTKVGAFLDWGLAKDLFVPFREQRERMQVGRSYVVRIYIDESERIAASSKLTRFLNDEVLDFHEGQAVQLMICERTDLGYNALINNTHMGLLFESDVFQELQPGDVVPGYIKQLRPDRKITLSLHVPGYQKVGGVADTIMETLEKEGGFIPLNDKSSPKQIAAKFAVSKKTFKQAIGALYKKRLITIDESGIRKVG